MAEISNYSVIWERICNVTGWSKQKELADFLDIRASSITGPKRRGVFPIEWVVKVALAYEESVVYLLTGHIPNKYIRKDLPAVDENEEPKDQLAEDIKLWLDDLASDDANWRTWAEMELLDKLPKFKEWRDKRDKSV